MTKNVLKGFIIIHLPFQQHNRIFFKENFPIIKIKQNIIFGQVGVRHFAFAFLTSASSFFIFNNIFFDENKNINKNFGFFSLTCLYFALDAAVEVVVAFSMAD